MFLFWCMFLPIGKCASIDSMNNTKSSIFESKYDFSSLLYIISFLFHSFVYSFINCYYCRYIFSIATIATMAQFCIIYWFTVLIKSGAEWNVDYTATYYALHLDQVLIVIIIITIIIIIYLYSFITLIRLFIYLIINTLFLPFYYSLRPVGQFCYVNTSN